METWIWRFLALRLPSDWEMLSFSRDSEVGRCVFADRYAHRLEMSWRTVGGPPDRDRMLSDYETKLSDDGAKKVNRTSYRDWYGISAHVAGCLTTRFVHYFEDQGCLLELVLLWPEKRDEALEHQILDQVASVPVPPGGLQRWRAFGMDVSAAGVLPLGEVTVRPAMVEMTFGDEKRGDHLRFARLGLVPHWLGQSLERWMTRKYVMGDRLENRRRTQRGRHDIMTLLSSRSISPIRGLFGMRRHQTACGWICPHDGRLYLGVHAYTARRAREDAMGDGWNLGCCAEMGARP